MKKMLAVMQLAVIFGCGGQGNNTAGSSTSSQFSNISTNVIQDNFSSAIQQPLSSATNNVPPDPIQQPVTSATIQPPPIQQPVTSATVTPVSEWRVELAWSNRLLDESWEYVLALPVALIANEKDQPFVMSSLNNWLTEALTTEHAGFYKYAFTAQNGSRARIVYGGNKVLGSWAYIKNDPFYNLSADALDIEFMNGQIYKTGTAPSQN